MVVPVVVVDAVVGLPTIATNSRPPPPAKPTREKHSTQPVHNNNARTTTTKGNIEGDIIAPKKRTIKKEGNAHAHTHTHTAK